MTEEQIGSNGARLIRRLANIEGKQQYDQSVHTHNHCWQPASGSIAVAEEHVHLNVLPGLLAMLAESLQPLIQRECALLLERNEEIGSQCFCRMDGLNCIAR